MPAENPTTDPGIYQIRCLANGKIYVGSAINLRARWDRHRWSLSGNSHHSARLQRAWRKYGAQLFVFEVLEIVPELRELVHVEQRYLDQIRPFDPEIGYNICPSAGSVLGMKRSEEWRAMMSAAFKGRSYSDETRARMSAGQRGRKHSPEERAKRAASMVGRVVPPETRAKISAATKARMADPEARARQSAGTKALWADPEYRDKQLAALKSSGVRTKIVESSRKKSKARRSGRQAMLPSMD